MPHSLPQLGSLFSVAPHPPRERVRSVEKTEPGASKTKRGQIKILLSLLGFVFLSSCSMLQNTSTGAGELTEHETQAGLIEALTVGAGNSTTQASKTNGFWGNAAIRILFPPEAIKVKQALQSVGLTPVVERFELSMNRAAEKSASEAKPILIKAIKSISFKDVFEILFGGKDAATQYLRQKTEPQLKAKFQPIVKRSLDEVEVTKYWNQMLAQYDQIPFMPAVNADLETYVTDKTLDGLFTLIADEERKIRENPIARISELLRKVFGKQDKG